MRHLIFTLLILLGASPLFAESNVINILDLGAKNDGSADISAIINENTARGTIYLPAGLYRVEQPLHLKNPIHGDGYSRNPHVNASKTWLLSEIDCDYDKHGVIEYGEEIAINVENLNIRCHSREDGILVKPCSQQTSTFISQVGIYNASACGIRIVGDGSRPVFVNNVTIFSCGPNTRSVGLDVDPNDCRLSNIEVMGCQVGLKVRGGHTYCSNLHLWTGVMGKDIDGTWWNGTRGIVLSGGGIFVGSQIYPDTSYIVFEQEKDSFGCFDISEILYYDDNSEKASTDKEGMLYYAHPDCPSPNLGIHGGIFAVCGTDAKKRGMSKLYTPGMNIDNVIVPTDRLVCGANIDVLCMGDALPDYTLEYEDKGWCKVADIFDMAPSGSVQADLSLDNGAAWQVNVLKTADGKKKVKFEPQNELCKPYKLKYTEKNGLVKIFVLTLDDKLIKVRFTTRSMCPYFRPADYSSLRTLGYQECYYEVE